LPIGHSLGKRLRGRRKVIATGGRRLAKLGSTGERLPGLDERLVADRAELRVRV
jgi:hypothetical protein